MNGLFKKDSLILGILLGLILPGTAATISYLLQRNITVLGKEDILYIGSAALNLILVKLFMKHDCIQSGRGVVMATFICAFIFLFYKTNQ